MNKSDSATYNSWKLMRRRCFSKSSDDYENYGGRGITVCDRWHDFDNFLADMGEKPQGYSIERIDVNGNYCPENCCWIPMALQSRNRRTVRWIEIGGEKRTFSEWCRHFGIAPVRGLQRLAWGWSEYEAVSKPLMQRGPKRRNI